jgi:hypothetical protein
MLLIVMEQYSVSEEKKMERKNKMKIIMMISMI